MRLNSFVVFAACLLAFANTAAAQQFLTDRTRSVDSATHVAGQQAPTTAAARELARQCAVVVGLQKYCDCLGAQLPGGMSFDQYVVVLGRSKQDNGYAGMSATVRRAYDTVPQVRDRCAAGVGATP